MAVRPAVGRRGAIAAAADGRRNCCVGFFRRIVRRHHLIRISHKLQNSIFNNAMNAVHRTDRTAVQKQSQARKIAENWKCSRQRAFHWLHVFHEISNWWLAKSEEIFFVSSLGCGYAVAIAITRHENHSIQNSFWLILILSNARQSMSSHQHAAQRTEFLSKWISHPWHSLDQECFDSEFILCYVMLQQIYLMEWKFFQLTKLFRK